MNIKIQNKSMGAIIPQYIDRDWYNELLTPCLEFSFEQDEDALIFSATRLAPAHTHPEAELNKYQAELWKYDVVEFFLAKADGSRYMEFNLSANGAWWAEIFCAARQIETGIKGIEGVTCKASMENGAWKTEARIPLAEIVRLDIDLADCRLAFCAIQNSPEQVFLTTAEPLVGEPDFHQPQNWPMAK